MSPPDPSCFGSIDAAVACRAWLIASFSQIIRSHPPFSSSSSIFSFLLCRLTGRKIWEENRRKKLKMVVIPLKKDKGSGWSSVEGISKGCCYERWEKIAAAVPRNSKAARMKIVTELKKEFRSAQAAADALKSGMTEEGKHGRQRNHKPRSPHVALVIVEGDMK